MPGIPLACLETFGLRASRSFPASYIQKSERQKRAQWQVLASSALAGTAGAVPDPWIDIPGEVLDILRLWRPTPLVRATRLEAAILKRLNE